MPVILTADDIGGVLLTGYSASWLGLVAAGGSSAGAVGPQPATWGSAGVPTLAWLPSAGDSAVCCHASIRHLKQSLWHVRGADIGKAASFSPEEV